MSWPTRTLGELADSSGGEIRTGPFGSQLHRHDYTDSEAGIPVVMPLNMSGGRVNLSGIERISRDKATELSAHITRVGDILLARRGDIGRYCLIDETIAGVLCGTGSLRISIQKSEVLPEYLALYLETAPGRHQLQGRAVGATMPNINANIVRSFSIPIPPLNTQRKIVALLSAYERLIENNARRSAAALEMVQRTFREWFVRLNGPQRGSQQLQSSGSTPEGWEIRNLSELTTLITRGIGPRYSEDAEPLVINQRCIRDGAVDLSYARKHSSAVPEAKLLCEGDILINSTGVGTLGRVAQVIFEPRGLTVDSHVSIVRPATEVVSSDFLGLALLDREEEISGLGIGSTGQTELGRTAIGRVAVIVPPLSYQSQFSELVHAMRLLPITLGEASKRLSLSRELLLPRVVSGAIDVDEIEMSAPVEAA